jgi:hypothetical protein
MKERESEIEKAENDRSEIKMKVQCTESTNPAQPSPTRRKDPVGKNSKAGR